MAEKAGWDETKAIWRKPENRLFYKLMGAVVLVGVGIWIGRLIYAAPEADQAWGYGVNLFTGVISTAATVLILDQLAERRADRKAEEALKRQLVDDAASLSHEIALNAVHQMRRKGWLEGEDGLLKGANLHGANLQGAGLEHANLQNANLSGANLRGAKLGAANLMRAQLETANLQGADLLNARMNGANFNCADLQGARLTAARLQAANLTDANLQDAIFGKTNMEAELYDQTKLPNGANWTPETDMPCFTDPNHPSFWRSKNPFSPAYRGDSTA